MASAEIITFNNQSLKAWYSTGATTRRGIDFDTLNVTWQSSWLLPIEARPRPGVFRHCVPARNSVMCAASITVLPAGMSGSV